jgi:ubiquinone/menaquinone biosynthesis C-methylase UbiE
MAGNSIALAALIRLSQHIGRGNFKFSFNVLQDTFVHEGAQKFTESDHEAKGLNEFFQRFPAGLLDEFAGKRILDLGCGYGGKAVETALRLPSSLVIGVEPHHKKIAKAREFAERRGARNCQFELCTQDSIPLDTGSIDVIMCHDVLEHVANPEVTLKEMHRVLRRGGTAYIVFPPYNGPSSHHLDFITQMPGLHWFFSADTIMDTVNNMLASEYGKRFKTPPQPSPTFSALAGRRVLPSLNGLGTRTLVQITDSLFSIDSIERTTVIDRLVKFRVPRPATEFAKRIALRLVPAAADHLTLTMAVTLRRL